MATRLSRDHLVTWVLPLGLALAILAPLVVGTGYALVGDMVFVPDQPWKGRWLGIDGSVPRAVPSDALTWLFGTLLPGDVVQKLVLLLILTLAGAGAARLTADRSAIARAAAVVLCVWNPYVYERLAIGHWALLAGYAALPWVAVAGLRVRERVPAAWSAALLPLAVAAWTSPTGGVLAVLVFLAVVAPRPRLLLPAVGVAGFVNLPWLLPGLFNTGGLAADDFGVEAFAARADTPWGTLGSVLSLGGIWKESVAAPGRDAWLLSGLALALVVAALAGLVLAARSRRPGAWSLLAVGLLGLVLAVVPTTGPGQELFSWLVVEVPGGGLLRDSQKWVALLVPGLVVGVAELVDRIRAGWIAVLLPVLVLPGLGWGLLGTLAPADYPDDWFAARRAMERAEIGDDRAVVLPFGVYRRFEWNHGNAVLDPLPRFLPGELITDDALAVEGGTVGGEDPLAAQIRAVAEDSHALTVLLRSEGIRWVVVHLDDGQASVPVPTGEVVHLGSDLLVVRLDQVAEVKPPNGRDWYLVVDGLVLLGVLSGVGHILARRRYSAERE